MGAGTSKPTKVAGQVARKYPTRASPSTRTTPSPASTLDPRTTSAPSQALPQASFNRTDAINNDARDPAFASRLHKLGIVAPNPFIPLSSHDDFQNPDSYNSSPASYPSSTGQSVRPAVRENASLHVFRMRETLQKQYEDEQDAIGRKGFAGRKFLDVGTIREVVRLRGKGVSDTEIEGRMGLEKGIAGRMGPDGVVKVVDL